MEKTPITVNIEDLREVGDFSGGPPADRPIGHGLHAVVIVHRPAIGRGERADANWTLIGQDTHSSVIVQRPATGRGERANANWVAIKGE